MVVIVPTLAQGDEGEDRAVARIVGSLETTFPHQVSHRVDATGAVEEKGGADEEAPDEHLPAIGAESGSEGFEGNSETEKRNRKEDGHNEIEAVEPDDTSRDP